MPTDPDTPELKPPDDFAPRDLTDGRPKGDWQSRYPDQAWTLIRGEAMYLAILLLLSAGFMVLIWSSVPFLELRLTPQRTATLSRYSFAWLGGTLGGVLFAMKWLYHSVAKLRWHQDRALWRYFTPHISGGLAFAVVATLDSISNSCDAVSSTGRALSVGFLVGFFSDNALAKLAEVAETLLGITRRGGDRSSSKKADEESD